MSDRDLIRKLANIVIKQNKIINKLAGVNWAAADTAMKELLLSRFSGLVAPYGGSAKVALFRSAVADNATAIEYDVDVKLSVANQESKAKVESQVQMVWQQIEEALNKIASSEEASPLKGCKLSADRTVTVLVA
jgi:ABC-type dipeptide/oligopeptide/nickel transport system ATPase subunit